MSAHLPYRLPRRCPDQTHRLAPGEQQDLTIAAGPPPACRHSSLTEPFNIVPNELSRVRTALWEKKRLKDCDGKSFHRRVTQTEHWSASATVLFYSVNVQVCFHPGTFRVELYSFYTNRYCVLHGDSATCFSTAPSCQCLGSILLLNHTGHHLLWGGTRLIEEYTNPQLSFSFHSIHSTSCLSLTSSIVNCWV
ncbi:hypothetical protein COCON_G00034270 [Conger conger]|uniref:Uncharacterized protein n=1 Tax=Conger conger TaxID=82655 RepID=A0A9Q1I5P3_CONCO|nr:hypothetical protein COCON_G00034270 [Conger conger]